MDGEIWTVDAEGIAAALFRQHTSRELDPQIHTHIVIPNRVAAPDGRWLALDARTVKRDQRTLSAIYHAGLRAELTDRLGVRWHEPKDGIAEMADIDPDVLDVFSTRTRAVQTRLDRKIDRFVDSLGREPTPRERWRLEREAVIDSRPSKTSADAPSLHQEWTARLVALGTEREALVGDITGRANVEEPDLFTNGRIGARAVDALSEQQSTWRAAEITREIARALPTNTASTAREVLDWVEQLSLEVEYDLIVDLTPPVAGHVPVRRDGRPVTEAAVERILTTSEILAQEDEIVTRAQARVDGPGQDLVDLADSTLSGVQHEVAAAVAGTRPLVLVVGPAGTGKTTALQPAVDRLRTDGRVVFGVTPSATAADVLATDTGVDADTLDKLLIEHRLDRPPDHRFDLPAGATVVVDEAAMVSTPALLELVALADRQRWRLALVGDPMQFAAVGRSGMFGHLVDTFGAIELDRVHRFADGWERETSLALRQGDSDVVAIYDEHGRIHGGTGSQMRRAVLNAWWEAELAGERTAMMAPTNEAIVRLNLAAQYRRLDAGQLDRTGPTVAVGEYTIHEGDRIATRRNDRLLRTDRRQMVKNRDHWIVDAVHADGSLAVTGRTGSVRLGSEYVAEHVELAYAETSHANQGRTVDRSFLYLDGTTDSRGIYVPLTRGRLTNEAFVVTEGEAIAADIVAEAVARTWVDQPAITHRLDHFDLFEIRRAETEPPGLWL